MAEDAAPQGKKLGQKFSATFMARKVRGMRTHGGWCRASVRRCAGVAELTRALLSRP